jgi:hypothetical protein
VIIIALPFGQGGGIATRSRSTTQQFDTPKIIRAADAEKDAIER